MALIEHLREFRNRLGISLLALAVSVVVALIFRERVFDFVKRPYCDTEVAQEAAERRAASATCSPSGPSSSSRSRCAVSLIVGVLASSPVWLYQFGAFITPALHRKEKRYAAAFLTASLILFCTGRRSPSSPSPAACSSC
jgi:sec-independent protein translocase protein TatC